MALTPLPPAPEITDQANFQAEAQALVLALNTLVTELNAIIGLTIPAGSAAAGTLTGNTLAANVTSDGYGFLARALMRASADQSITSNTTLASATNMSFAIAANEEWVADFYLDVGGTLFVTGMQWAVTVPAGATLNAICALTPDATDTVTRTAKRTTTGGAAMDFTVATMPYPNFGLLHVSLLVLNGANAGTVQLQIAQSTSSATALVLRKGSHGVAWRKA